MDAEGRLGWSVLATIRSQTATRCRSMTWCCGRVGGHMSPASRSSRPDHHRRPRDGDAVTTNLIDVLAMWFGSGPPSPKYCRSSPTRYSGRVQFGAEVSGAPSDFLELTATAGEASQRRRTRWRGTCPTSGADRRREGTCERRGRRAHADGGGVHARGAHDDDAAKARAPRSVPAGVSASGVPVLVAGDPGLTR